MATGKVKTLFENAAQTQAIFPRTKIEAISDNDGQSLQSILNSKLSANITINGKSLHENITLGASQVGAISYNTPQTFTTEQLNTIKSNLNLQNPDWEENDPNSPAYIKNRTHWKETIESSENVINEISHISETLPNYGGQWDKGNITFEHGKKYKITGSNKKGSNEKIFIYDGSYITLWLPGADAGDGGGSLYCKCNFDSTGVVIEYIYQYGPESFTTDMPSDLMYSLKFALYEIKEGQTTYHPLAAEYLPIPNMEENQEYLAMEKHMGKQVYTKIINFGPVPSSGTRNIAYHDSEAVIPIRMHSYVVKNDQSKIYTLPYVDPSSGVSDILQGNFKAIYPHASNNLVSIRSTTDEPDASIYAIVWYIYK